MQNWRKEKVKENSAMQGGEDYLNKLELHSLGMVVGELNDQVSESLKHVSLNAL